MSSHPGSAPIEEYWDWFAVALFLLITVDLITTIYAAWAVGLQAERNPLIRWALTEGMVTVVIVNITATVVAVGGFYLLLEFVGAAKPPFDRYLALGVEIWLGSIIAIGLVIFANNLYVIFHGYSLLF